MVDNIFSKAHLTDLVSLRAGGVPMYVETKFPNWQGNNALRRTISSPTFHLPPGNEQSECLSRPKDYPPQLTTAETVP